MRIDLLIARGSKLCVLICFTALACVPAFAQTTDCKGKGWYVSLENAYVGVNMGTVFRTIGLRETYDFHDDCPPDCTNQRTALARWGMWTNGGDPETGMDDNCDIIRQSYYWGPVYHNAYATINVDGTTGIIGDDSAGYFTSPYAYYAQWPDAPEGDVFIRYVWVSKTGNIQVELQLTLVRDQARFEWTLTNRDSAPHSVGFRTFTDVLVNDDGSFSGCVGDIQAFPYIPGVGFIGAVETVLQGAQVPSLLEVYSSKADPDQGVRFTLKEGDATPPDWVAIGEWSLMEDDIWDYTVDPFNSVRDHAVAIRWNPTLLRAGESKRIVTYYGLAAASSEYSFPYVLAVQAPKALKYSSTEGKNNLTPNPFTVTAYVTNLYHNVDLRNVNLFINLPDGLKLADSETSAVKKISHIRPTAEGTPVSWEVEATGDVSGEVTFTVSASGASIPAKTVKRKISIPMGATGKLDRGWQMLAVPFNFVDPDPLVALNLRPADFEAVRWNTTKASYDRLTALSPAAGFWLWASRGITSVDFKNPVPVDMSSTFELKLSTGWNQIGEPFLYNVAWGRVKVLYQGEIVLVEDAANRGWIRRTLYWYDTGRKEYDFGSSTTLALEPWRGYWLKAMVPCSLIFPPDETIGGGISTSLVRPTASIASTAAAYIASPPAVSEPVFDGWSVCVAASADGVSDSRNFIGMARGASDGYDTFDAEDPPPWTDKLNLRIVNPRCGEGSSLLARDIRTLGGPQTYDLEITAARKGVPVRISWSWAESVPAGYMLTLADPIARLRRDMRRCSEYTFRNSTANAVRRLQVIATPIELKLQGLRAYWNGLAGKVGIVFGLSEDAVVNVRVLDSAGNVVRNLISGKEVRKGTVSLSWDCRDDGGAAVRGGRYTVDVGASAAGDRTAGGSCTVNIGSR